MSRDGGFYLMRRGWWGNPVFKNEPYTEREAWEWIIANAAWKDGRVRVKTFVVDVKRGQLAASLRYMADAWQWQEPRVRRYLARLEKAEMIECVADAGVSVISVCNYEEYQVPARVADAQNDAASTQDRRSIDANKNEGNKELTLEADASKATVSPPDQPDQPDLLGQDPCPGQPQSQDPDASFGEWWQSAPRKVSKGAAERSFHSPQKLPCGAFRLVSARVVADATQDRIHASTCGEFGVSQMASLPACWSRAAISRMRTGLPAQRTHSRSIRRQAKLLLFWILDSGIGIGSYRGGLTPLHIHRWRHRLFLLPSILHLQGKFLLWRN